MHLILRHGETEANAHGVFRGQGDWPLNAKGRKQAHDAIPIIEKFHPQRIVRCGLERHKETGEIVNSALAVPVIEDDDLAPLDVGKFTGKNKKENWQYFSHYLDHPDEKIPKGESISHFRIRNAASLHKYFNEDTPTLIILSTSNITDQHGGRVEDDHVVPPGGLLAVIGPHHFMRLN